MVLRGDFTTINEWWSQDWNLGHPGLYWTRGLGLTKLMVVGKAKAIYMTLKGDGKSEVGATESILEFHVSSASPGFKHHTFGDQESFCRQRKYRGQWQTHRASLLWPVLVSPSIMKGLRGNFLPIVLKR